MVACTAGVNENFKAYGIVNHRHTPEIEQAYSEFAGEDVVIQFTPHLLPVDRGILATCYANLKEGVTDAQVAEALKLCMLMNILSACVAKVLALKLKTCVLQLC